MQSLHASARFAPPIGVQPTSTIAPVLRACDSHPSDAMSTQDAIPAPLVLLAGVDSTPSADLVIDAAVSFAKPSRDPHLHLIHVVPSLHVDAVSASKVLESSRELLDRLGHRARDEGAAHVVTHLAIGEPWQQIVQMAEHLRADLLVLGTRGRRGLQRWMLGSTAEQLVRRASCPVYVAKPKEYPVPDVPEIEPACPECLQTQKESKGERLWCARHVRKHPHAHLHYETPESFGLGSMLIRP